MSLPTFDLPRACRFSRVDWDWAAASLSLQQRLLLTFQDQDLPFVSSHHNTALSRTHPSSRPTQLPRADSKTCRDSSTSCLEYILPPLTLHIIAIPPYTTPLFPRICHPEIAACDDPTSLDPLNLHLRRSCDLTTVALCTLSLLSRRSTSFTNTISSTTVQQQIRHNAHHAQPVSQTGRERPADLGHRREDFQQCCCPTKVN